MRTLGWQRLLVMAFLAVVLTACGPRPEVRGPSVRTPSVVLVMIDGLTERHLTDYLASAESRGDDRVLARLLRAPSIERSTEPPESVRTFVWSALPVKAEVNAAAMLGTAAPDALQAADASRESLQKLLENRGHTVIDGDTSFVGPQSTQADEERLESALTKARQLPSRPAVVSLRFGSLALASAKADQPEVQQRLGRIDQLLARAARAPSTPLTEDAYLVLASTGGPSATTLFFLDSVILAKELGLPEASLVPQGPMLQIKGVDRAGWERVTALPTFQGTLFVGTPSGTFVYDRELEALRPPTSYELEPAELLGAVPRTLRAGNAVWILPVKLQALQAFQRGPKTDSDPALFGKLDPADARLPVRIAGPGLHAESLGADADVTRIAPTILSLLGISEDTLGKGAPPPLLGSRQANPVASAAPISKCHAAALAGAGLREACAAQLRSTSEREPAAEAIVALALTETGEASKKERETWLRLATLLSADATSRMLRALRHDLRFVQPERECRANDGMALLGSVKPPAGKAPAGVQVTACNIAIGNTGTLATMGDRVSLAVGRAMGARTVVWRTGTAGPFSVTILTPRLRQWLGPEALTFSVPDAGKDAAVAALPYHEFGRGLSDWHDARSSVGLARMAAAAQLSETARQWRDLFATVNAEPTEWPGVEAESWPASIALAYRKQDRPSGWKPTQVQEEFLTSLTFALSSDPVRAVCEDGAPPPVPREALTAARRAGNACLAGRVELRLVDRAASDAKRLEHLGSAFAAAADPAVGWCRGSLLQRVVWATTDLPQLRSKATEAYHAELRRRVNLLLADRGADYARELLKLLDGAMSDEWDEVPELDREFWVALYATALKADPAVRTAFETRAIATYDNPPVWWLSFVGVGVQKASELAEVTGAAYKQVVGSERLLFKVLSAATILTSVAPHARAVDDETPEDQVQLVQQQLGRVRQLGKVDDLVTTRQGHGADREAARVAINIRLMSNALEVYVLQQRSKPWAVEFAGAARLAEAALLAEPRSAEYRTQLGTVITMLSEIARAATALDAQSREKAVVAARKHLPAVRAAFATDAVRVPGELLPYLQLAAIEGLWFVEKRYGFNPKQNDLDELRPRVWRLFDALEVRKPGLPLAPLALGLQDSLGAIAMSRGAPSAALWRIFSKTGGREFDNRIPEREIRAGLDDDEPAYAGLFWLRELLRNFEGIKKPREMMETVARRTAHLASDVREPNSRALLLLSLLLLTNAGEATSRAVMAHVPDNLSGTRYDDVGFLFALAKARHATFAGRTADAAAGMDRLDASCPGLRWQWAYLRATKGIQADGRDWIADLERYRRGAIGFRSAGQKGALTLKTLLEVGRLGEPRKGEMGVSRGLVQLTVSRELALTQVASFGYGTGIEGTSVSFNDKDWRATVVVQPLGTGDDAQAYSWLVQARLGIERDDHRAAEAAMVEYLNLVEGWKREEGPSGPRFSRTSPSFDEMEAAIPLWVGALAESAGHPQLGARVAESASRLLNLGPSSVLSTDDCARDDGSKLELAACRLPEIFEGRPYLSALKETVKWRAALNAGRKAAPRALSGAMHMLSASAVSRTANARLDAAMRREASGGAGAPAGFACEHALRDEGSLESQVAAARACGLRELYRRVLLKAAAEADGAELAFTSLEEAIRLEGETGAIADDLVDMVSSILARRSPTIAELAPVARRLASAAGTGALSEMNIRLRIAALSAEVLLGTKLGERPDNLLNEAQRNGMNAAELAVVKWLVFQPDNVAASRSAARRFLGVAPQTSSVQ